MHPMHPLHERAAPQIESKKLSVKQDLVSKSSRWAWTHQPTHSYAAGKGSYKCAYFQPFLINFSSICSMLVIISAENAQLTSTPITVVRVCRNISGEVLFMEYGIGCCEGQCIPKSCQLYSPFGVRLFFCFYPTDDFSIFFTSEFCHCN